MAIVERHTSPDGAMVLLVDLTADDWTVGFDGYASCASAADAQSIAATSDANSVKDVRERGVLFIG